MEDLNKTDLFFTSDNEHVLYFLLTAALLNTTNFMETTRQQNLLTSSSNRTIRASAAVAQPVNQDVKPTQRAVI